MRGGLERWKRGVESRGVRQAVGYALEGTCDAHLQHSPGVDALEAYSAASNPTVSRFIVASGRTGKDELTAGGLRVWLTGHDPVTGRERGHQRLSPGAELRRSDTLLYGRVTYELLEGAWRRPESGQWPEWMDDSEVAFAEVMDPMRKVVASGTLDVVDWNAELIRDDVVDAVRQLTEQPGRGISLGGVTLPATLAAHGLIDEYTFVVHPVVAGRGPRLLDRVDLELELVERRVFRSGASVQRYRPAA